MMLDTTYRQYVAAIDAAAVDAEIDVLESMAAVYDKQARILMECDMEDLPEYASMFQEGEMQDPVDKGDKGILSQAKGNSDESLLKRILLFIPRLIKALFQRITALVKGGKNESDKLEKQLTSLKAEINKPRSLPPQQPEKSVQQSDKSTASQPAYDRDADLANYRHFKIKNMWLFKVDGKLHGHIGVSNVYVQFTDQSKKLYDDGNNVKQAIKEVLTTYGKLHEYAKYNKQPSETEIKAAADACKNGLEILRSVTKNTTKPFLNALRKRMDVMDIPVNLFRHNSNLRELTWGRGFKEHEPYTDVNLGEGSSPYVLKFASNMHLNGEKALNANNAVEVENFFETIENLHAGYRRIIDLYAELKDMERDVTFMKMKQNTVQDWHFGIDNEHLKNASNDTQEQLFYNSCDFFNEVTAFLASCNEISIRLDRVQLWEFNAISKAIKDFLDPYLKHLSRHPAIVKNQQTAQYTVK